MEGNVKVISMELIKPSSPTPLEIKDVKMSSLDQFAPFFFVPLLFFYENGSDSTMVDPSKRSQHLKKSLSETLAKFYPLAGKLRQDGSIDCDDSGALFVEGKVHAPLSQAFQNVPLDKLNQFLPFEPYSTSSDDKLRHVYPRNDILLAVQITWFECRGNAIGVCISHKAGDFMSLLTFVNSWAASSGCGITDPYVREPNFCLGRDIFPPLKLLPKFSRPVKKGKIICKRFLFGKEKIAELKQLATSPSGLAQGSSLVKDPSRVEVVTAFLWKHFINLARAKNQATKTKFIATHAVDLRSRIRSLASADEFPFGNFSFISFASFISDDDQGEKDYGDLVWRTSTAMRKVNEDHVMKSVYPFSNGLWIIGEGEDAAVMSDWSFTSWCRPPVYELDFGWGKPVSVCPAGTRIQNGVILMSTKSGDGIEAWVAMLEDEVAMLADEFASLVSADIFP